MFAPQRGQQLRKREYCFPIWSQQLFAPLTGQTPSFFQRPAVVCSSLFLPEQLIFLLLKQHLFLQSQQFHKHKGIGPGDVIKSFVYCLDTYLQFCRRTATEDFPELFSPVPQQVPFLGLSPGIKRGNFPVNRAHITYAGEGFLQHFPQQAHNLGLKLQKLQKFVTLQFHI